MLMALMERNEKSDITDLSENGYTCFMTNGMINRSQRAYTHSRYWKSWMGKNHIIDNDIR